MGHDRESTSLQSSRQLFAGNIETLKWFFVTVSQKECKCDKNLSNHMSFKLTSWDLG